MRCSCDGFSVLERGGFTSETPSVVVDLASGEAFRIGESAVDQDMVDVVGALLGFRDPSPVQGDDASPLDLAWDYTVAQWQTN